MTRPRVFVTQPVAPRAIETLQRVADVRSNPDPLHIMTKAELTEAVRAADYLFCLLADRIDDDVIATNSGLKMIMEGRRPPNCVNPEIYG